MKTKKIIIAVLALGVLTACLAILIIKMQGETKTTGSYPDKETSRSLICESQDKEYPFFTQNESKAKNLKIAANFYNNKISAISLTYILYYDSESQIVSSEAHNHAAMNIDFGKSGLSADALDANYSKMTDSLKMILYVNENDFNVTTAKYFLIDVKEKRDLPNTLTDFEKYYKTQGLSCSTKN